jgi:5-(carboxyamino)imidazole ribonucleotide mutase
MATSKAPKKKHPALVGIVTGSPRDLEKVQEAARVLDKLGIGCEVMVLSAHRTPERVVEYVTSAPGRGIEVLIACAGLANHLAGAVAAHTTLPVIGVPLSGGALGGLDALLSTVQMPPGVPVATVGVDGAQNAAHLAARILALKHHELTERIEADREERKKQYDSAKR